MQPPKIHWAGNIKFLRSRAKLSQDELAATLSISRSKLNAHENGNTVNPTAEDLVAFSAHFGFSIDTLLKLELSQLSRVAARRARSRQRCIYYRHQAARAHHNGG